MTKKNFFGMMTAGILSLAANQFIYFPVFAENPVDISIIELVDDGNGGYKQWEDITDAVPGASYSAIPRVKNNGEVPASVRMCLSESAKDSAGNPVALSEQIFEIEINSNWTLDDPASDASDPAAGNCYKYNSLVEVGAVTEPLFTEVVLSSALGNSYENSSFTLHLDADAIGTEGNHPTSPDADADTIGTEGNRPTSPDTGTITSRESFLTNSGIVFLSAGILALTIRIIRKKLFKKS